MDSEIDEEEANGSVNQSSGEVGDDADSDELEEIDDEMETSSQGTLASHDDGKI